MYRLPVPRPGQVLGLVGTNGIGKSTALKVLAGKLKPNLGRFNVKSFQFCSITILGYFILFLYLITQTLSTFLLFFLLILSLLFLFQNPPDWQEILTYFRGSELQNYFTRILEDNLKVGVTMYIQHLVYIFSSVCLIRITTLLYAITSQQVSIYTGSLGCQAFDILNLQALIFLIICLKPFLVYGFVKRLQRLRMSGL